MFKEQQRQEMKLLKQELDLMSKDNKKEAMRKRRDEKEIELAEKVYLTTDIVTGLLIHYLC